MRFRLLPATLATQEPREGPQQKSLEKTPVQDLMVESGTAYGGRVRS